MSILGRDREREGGRTIIEGILKYIALRLLSTYIFTPPSPQPFRDGPQIFHLVISAILVLAVIATCRNTRLYFLWHFSLELRTERHPQLQQSVASHLQSQIWPPRAQLLTSHPVSLTFFVYCHCWLCVLCWAQDLACPALYMPSKQLLYLPVWNFKRQNWE